MLFHVPSIGSCSKFCLILQPHCVAVRFAPTFASPWRNSFVQIHGGTTLLKEKFRIIPQKRPKNDLNWGVGSSYGTNKTPLPNHLFPYEIAEGRADFFGGNIYIYSRNVRTNSSKFALNAQKSPNLQNLSVVRLRWFRKNRWQELG